MRGLPQLFNRVDRSGTRIRSTSWTPGEPPWFSRDNGISNTRSLRQSPKPETRNPKEWSKPVFDPEAQTRRETQKKSQTRAISGFGLGVSFGFLISGFWFPDPPMYRT